MQKIEKREDFDKVVVETVEILEKESPEINKAVDNIFALRTWFLREYTAKTFMSSGEHLFLQYYSTILSNLDNLASTAFTKDIQKHS